MFAAAKALEIARRISLRAGPKFRKSDHGLTAMSIDEPPKFVTAMTGALHAIATKATAP